MCWTRTDMLEADQGRGDCSDPSGDAGLLGLETLTPEGRGQAEDLQSAKQSIASVQPCPSDFSIQRWHQTEQMQHYKCDNVCTVGTSHHGELQEWGTWYQAIRVSGSHTSSFPGALQSSASPVCFATKSGFYMWPGSPYPSQFILLINSIFFPTSQLGTPFLV